MPRLRTLRRPRRPRSVPDLRGVGFPGGAHRALWHPAFRGIWQQSWRAWTRQHGHSPLHRPRGGGPVLTAPTFVLPTTVEDTAATASRVTERLQFISSSFWGRPQAWYVSAYPLELSFRLTNLAAIGPDHGRCSAKRRPPIGPASTR